MNIRKISGSPLLIGFVQEFFIQRRCFMETIQMEAPALYGDHHVSEVRRVLFAVEGVREVYASSAFHIIEITFEPEKVSAGQLEELLRGMGYLDELPVPMEAIPMSASGNGKHAFRQTAFLESSRQVGFLQPSPTQQRAVWPCPGFGLLKMDENE